MKHIVLWKDNKYTIILLLTNTIQHLWTGATGSIPESSFIPLLGAALSKKKKKILSWPKGGGGVFQTERTEYKESWILKFQRCSLATYNSLEWRNCSRITRHYNLKKYAEWFSFSSVLGTSLSKCSKTVHWIHRSPPTYYISCFLIFLRPIFSISMLYHSDEGSYHHPDNYGYKIFH